MLISEMMKGKLMSCVAEHPECRQIAGARWASDPSSDLAKDSQFCTTSVSPYVTQKPQIHLKSKKDANIISNGKALTILPHLSRIVSSSRSCGSDRALFTPFQKTLFLFSL